MAEALKNSGGEQQGESGARYEMPSDVPKFDPKRALELRRAHRIEGVKRDGNVIDATEMWQAMREKNMAEDLGDVEDDDEGGDEGLSAAAQKVLAELNGNDLAGAGEGAEEAKPGAAEQSAEGTVTASVAGEQPVAGASVSRANDRRASVAKSGGGAPDTTMWSATTKAAEELHAKREAEGAERMSAEPWAELRKVTEEIYGERAKAGEAEKAVDATGGAEKAAGTASEAEKAAESLEARLGLNRDMYNDLVKRRLYLVSQYRSDKVMQANIRKEREAITRLSDYLLASLELPNDQVKLLNVDGEHEVVIPVSNGVVGEDFGRFTGDDKNADVADEFAKLLADVEAGRKEDPKVADELPKVDITSYEELLKNAKSGNDLGLLQNYLVAISPRVDMDTRYALHKIELAAREKYQKFQEKEREALAEGQPEDEGGEWWYDSEEVAQQLERMKPRMEFNRKPYEDLARRRVYWQTQFPDLKEAPVTVQSEVEYGNKLMRSMLQGVVADASAVQTVEDADGKEVVINPEASSDYNVALAMFRVNRNMNKEMVDEAALAAVKVPDDLEDTDIDLDDLEDRYYEADNLDQEQRLLESIQDKMGMLGIKAALALTMLYNHLHGQLEKEMEAAKTETGEVEAAVAGVEPEAAAVSAEESAGEGSEETVVKGIETAESRKNSNRDMYNDLVKRRMFLLSQYPDMSKAPDSIQEEYSTARALAGYLRAGVPASLHGAMLKPGVGGEDVVIDSFHRVAYDDAMKRMGVAREANTTLLDPEAEAAFELPKVDVAEYEKRLAEAKSNQEVLEISSEVGRKMEDVDMDAMYALARRLNNKVYKEKMEELQEAEERGKVDLKSQQLEEAVKQKEQEWRDARDAYVRAGFFGKLGLRLRGKTNFDAMAKEIEDARKAVYAWHSDPEYLKFHGGNRTA